MSTRREIFDALCRAAEPLYGEAEARSIAEMILLSKCGISRTAFIVDPMAEACIEELDSIIEEISRWRPVQYILGEASFDDMELEVGEGVLVPRPETEELVAWIAQESAMGAHIVDVCTGSGAIAIALARRIRCSKVVGIDLSAEALAIARRNAARYAPEVEIVEDDALGEFSVGSIVQADVVVSNPPYIPEADRALMRRNVIDYEPAMALFVSDDDPLCFYRSIARRAQSLLRVGGALYFEIYETLAAQMCELLASEGYSEITLREDFRGKPRMICARKR